MRIATRFAARIAAPLVAVATLAGPTLAPAQAAQFPSPAVVYTGTGSGFQPNVTGSDSAVMLAGTPLTVTDATLDQSSQGFTLTRVNPVTPSLNYSAQRLASTPGYTVTPAAPGEYVLRPKNPSLPTSHFYKVVVL